MTINKSSGSSNSLVRSLFYAAIASTGFGALYCFTSASSNPIPTQPPIPWQLAQADNFYTSSPEDVEDYIKIIEDHKELSESQKEFFSSCVQNPKSIINIGQKNKEAALDTLRGILKRAEKVNKLMEELDENLGLDYYFMADTPATAAINHDIYLFARLEATLKHYKVAKQDSELDSKAKAQIKELISQYWRISNHLKIETIVDYIIQYDISFTEKELEILMPAANRTSTKMLDGFYSSLDNLASKKSKRSTAKIDAKRNSLERIR